MPSFLSRSARHTADTRHRGFLAVRKRTLAIGAILASTGLTGMPALPASAEVVIAEAEVAQFQSFSTGPSAPVVVAVRDSFGVTTYSLVQWPVPQTTTMSSDFGFRSCAGCSSDHLGIDLNPGSGFPIQSIADGVVVLAEESNSGLGVQIVIEHTINGIVTRSLYAHMQFGSMTVGVGDTVARGQVIGAVGNTGQSTGSHLHFGILVDGVEIDPHAWLLANANS